MNSVPVRARCRLPFNLTDLPDTLQEISLEDAIIDPQWFLDELEEISAMSYPALTRLDFRNCSFNSSGFSFTALQLSYLSLRDNNLSSIPVFNLTNLDTLDLSGNNIKVFDFAPYRTLVNLQTLNLSANGAYSVKDVHFKGLENLKCLDLSNNNIDTLSDKVLLPLYNLQYLNLSNNHLEILNEACFSSLLHLQQLDVSWNRLAKVIPGYLELPSLARLLLAGNPKLGNTRKPTLLVGTGRRLQTVDASRTGLKQVPAALTHSIRTLRLAGNSIRMVSCGDLDSYPLLQILDFTSNELKQIDDDALGRLDSLTVLYLTDNRLGAIPRSLPEKLKVLHLEKNRIRNIQSTDLQNLNQLETLILYDNKIKTIEENSFNYLSSVVSLDLSRNPIDILPPGMLTTSSKLEILKLSGIPALAQGIEEAVFPLISTEYLIDLDLSKSPGLAHQFLADTAALMAARELQELNIAYTGLEYVRSDLLHYLPQLRWLHLQGNPLNCTDLYWLGVWMRKQDTEEYEKVTCASPAEFWSIPLVDLQETQIDDAKTTENAFSSGRKELKENFEYNFTYINNDKVGDESIDVKLIRNISENDNQIPKETELENSTSSAGKLSMPCEKTEKSLAHPGMVILIISLLATVAILVLITSQITRKRNQNMHQQHEMEVSSIPSVTELW